MGIEHTILVVALCNFGIGLFIWFKNKRKKINIAAGLVASVLGFWVVSMFFYIEPIVLNSEFWIKAVYFLVLCLVVTWVYFFKLFLRIEDNKIPALFTVASFLFALILFCTDWWVKEVAYKSGGPETTLGPAYSYFGIFILLAMGWIIYFWMKRYRSAEGMAKMRLLYVFAGMIIYSLLATIFDIVIPLMTGSSEFFWISAYFSLFFVGTITYAILRHNLFNVKLIGTELLTFTLWIVILIRLLMSDSTEDIFLTSGVFLVSLVVGILLIRSANKEVEQLEELEEAYGKLKKLDETKNQFLSIASHQLRTPLSSMKGYISMVLSGNYGELEGKTEELLKKVSKSNQRLINLVNDLLNFSRLQMGKMKFDFKEVKIEKVIKGVIEELEKKAEEKDLYLKFEEPSNIPKVKVDVSKIRQVILNLIDNGIKYTEEGGVTIKVRHPEDSKIQVIVEDTGMGMTEDEKESLFKMFERGAEAMKGFPTGVGMGLFAAKQIVDSHNGKIEAESEGRNEGSRFIVTLLLNPEEGE